jgi:hypothetical protein
MISSRWTLKKKIIIATASQLLSLYYYYYYYCLINGKQTRRGLTSPGSRNSAYTLMHYYTYHILYCARRDLYTHIYIHIYECMCTCLYTRYKRVSYIDLNGSPGHAKYPSGSRSPPGPAILPLKGWNRPSLHAAVPNPAGKRRRHCHPRAHRSFACNINSRKIYIILRVYKATPTI